VSLSYDCPDCSARLQRGELGCSSCGRELTIHDQIALVVLSKELLGNVYHVSFIRERVLGVYPDIKKENLGCYDHAYGNLGGCRVCAILPNGGKPLFQAAPHGSGNYKVLGGVLPYEEA